jgi:hypothetical protein
MATAAGEVGAAGGPNVLGSIAAGFKSIEAIASAVLVAGTALATFFDKVQGWLAVALLAGSGLCALAIIVARVVMPAIEARRRRQVIAIPDERLRQPTTFRLRPYDGADHGGSSGPTRRTTRRSAGWRRQPSPSSTSPASPAPARARCCTPG